jgi:hypothetical protein
MAPSADEFFGKKKHSADWAHLVSDDDYLKAALNRIETERASPAHFPHVRALQTAQNASPA